MEWKSGCLIGKRKAGKLQLVNQCLIKIYGKLWIIQIWVVLEVVSILHVVPIVQTGPEHLQCSVISVQDPNSQFSALVLQYFYWHGTDGRHEWPF